MGRRLLQVLLFPILCMILAILFFIDIVLWIIFGDKFWERLSKYLFDKTVLFFEIKPKNK